MARNDEDGIRPDQRAVIERLRNHQASLDDLAIVFEDPADAYILAPSPLTVQQLSRIFGPRDCESDEQLARYPNTLRQRMRDESWRERRVAVQARRADIRRDAILQHEGEVWAVLGMEFHTTRMKHILDRWEKLNEYVSAQLADCEMGEAHFTKSLADACRALDVIEAQLVEIMPKLPLSESGADFWAPKGGDRDGAIRRIAANLASTDDADRAPAILALIEGGGGGNAF